MDPAAKNPEKSDKRSVSFSNGLAVWAEAFGESQTPKLTFSAVVCAALAEFRQRHEPNTDEAQLIAAARRVGVSRALKAVAALRRPSKRDATQ